MVGKLQKAQGRTFWRTSDRFESGRSFSQPSILLDARDPLNLPVGER